MKQSRWMILLIVLVLMTSLALAVYAGKGRLRNRMGGGLFGLGQQAADLNYLMVNGQERSYQLHVPTAYKPGTPLPLVIALHGGMGNAPISDRMTGLVALTESKHFILVTPNGSGPLKDRMLTWNAGHCCGWAQDHQVDDIAFIRQLIDTLSSQYSIDVKRIYITGLSNGGMMTYRLACELSDKVAAIAPVAGALGAYHGSETLCKPGQPVSVIAFHGTADQHVLYQGGTPQKTMDIKHERVDRSVVAMMDLWRKADQCSGKPVHSQQGSIETDVSAHCKAGSAVMLYTIVGGGHAWPGSSGPGWSGGDVPTQEISASSLMVDFFLKHPKP